MRQGGGGWGGGGGKGKGEGSWESKEEGNGIKREEMFIFPRFDESPLGLRGALESS